MLKLCFWTKIMWRIIRKLELEFVYNLLTKIKSIGIISEVKLEIDIYLNT